MKIRNVLLISVAAISLAACGQTVQPGTAGVKVKTLGTGAGVQPNALPVGWHGTGVGESIELYPTIQKTYSFTRDADERGTENEELTFTDRAGMVMTADVAITLKVEPAAAPGLFIKYRLSFDDLLMGPIRNDLRAALAAETELVGVDQLLAGGRQAVLSRALKTVQRKWSKEGVHVTQLEWIGSIRFPQVIMDSITARAQADQQVLAATAKVAVAEAEAKEKVAIAQGDADSTRIRGDALRTNPQVLEQMKIEKWDGTLPKVTGGATPFVSID